MFTKLHGKELSYNNLVDVDAAIALIKELPTTSFAIIKHTNVCGVAQRDTVFNSWTAALAGDQVSLAEELSKNIGTAADFSKMNVLQQNSLAKCHCHFVP